MNFNPVEGGLLTYGLFSLNIFHFFFFSNDNTYCLLRLVVVLITQRQLYMRKFYLFNETQTKGKNKKKEQNNLQEITVILYTRERRQCKSRRNVKMDRTRDRIRKRESKKRDINKTFIK